MPFLLWKVVLFQQSRCSKPGPLRIFLEKAPGNSVETRPVLKKCMTYLRDGDTLVAHSMDRLARNTEELLSIVRELAGKGVTVRFVKENLTFSGSDADPFKT